MSSISTQKNRATPPEASSGNSMASGVIGALTVGVSLCLASASFGQSEKTAAPESPKGKPVPEKNVGIFKQMPIGCDPITVSPEAAPLAAPKVLPRMGNYKPFWETPLWDHRNTMGFQAQRGSFAESYDSKLHTEVLRLKSELETQSSWNRFWVTCAGVGGIVAGWFAKRFFSEPIVVEKQLSKSRPIILMVPVRNVSENTFLNQPFSEN